MSTPAPPLFTKSPSGRNSRWLACRRYRSSRSGSWLETNLSAISMTKQYGTRFRARQCGQCQAAGWTCSCKPRACPSRAESGSGSGYAHCVSLAGSPPPCWMPRTAREREPTRCADPYTMTHMDNHPRAVRQIRSRLACRTVPYSLCHAQVRPVRHPQHGGAVPAAAAAWRPRRPLHQVANHTVKTGVGLPVPQLPGLG